MAGTRGGLARLAIERARAEKLIGPGDAVALIGDAPQDIEAAREAGARSIAVRTGISSAGLLEALSPDLLIDDLTCLDLAVI
jgi:phosphoglycolate phosphatase-like HAD superfamily hydrolase